LIHGVKILIMHNIVKVKNINLKLVERVYLYILFMKLIVEVNGFRELLIAQQSAMHHDKDIMSCS